MDTLLRQLRKQRGLTLEQVSIAIGSDTGNLSRVELGKQIPSRNIAAKLAKYFHNEINEMQILYPERYTPKRKSARNSLGISCG